MISELSEKPGGARNVRSWHLHTQRDYRPYWYIGKNKPELFDPEPVTLNITIDFYDNVAASEFQAKIIAMMPEPGSK